MHNGRVSHQGSPLELYDRPANTFVADFIGSPAMNLIAGTLGTKGRFDFEGGSLPITPREGGKSGRQVILGIRPAHLVLTDEGVPAEVVVVEPTGSETHVIFRMGAGEVTSVFRDRPALCPGDRVKLTAAHGVTHYSPPKPGDASTDTRTGQTTWTRLCALRGGGSW